MANSSADFLSNRIPVDDSDPRNARTASNQYEQPGFLFEVLGKPSRTGTLSDTTDEWLAFYDYTDFSLVFTIKNVDEDRSVLSGFCYVPKTGMDDFIGLMKKLSADFSID